MTIKTKIFNWLRTIFKINILERFLQHAISSNFPGSSLFSKLVPNNYQYLPKTFRTFIQNNIVFKVDIGDYVGHYLYFGFKNQEMDSLFSICKQGDVVIDIGANIGYTVLNFAKAVGPTGKVYGFEPDPYNYCQCMNNISLNNFTNISLFNCGLGNVKTTTKLFTDTSSNRGKNRILVSDPTANTEFSTIPVERFDDWALGHSFSKVDIIKIDVEGFELNVLMGAVETIKKYTPVLFIELDDKNLQQHNHSAKMLVSFLEELNYKIIDPRNSKQIVSASDFTNCHFDILCRP